jgi:hypothetical protein
VRPDPLWRVGGAAEPTPDRVVGELRVVADDRSIALFADHRSVHLDIQLDDDRASVLGFVQRGQAGRQPLRKHREHDDASIDRCRVLRGVVVDCRSFGHQRVDVRDPDVEADPVPADALGDLHLVEVARLAIVHRRPEEMP